MENNPIHAINKKRQEQQASRQESFAEIDIPKITQEIEESIEEALKSGKVTPEKAEQIRKELGEMNSKEAKIGEESDGVFSSFVEKRKALNELKDQISKEQKGSFDNITRDSFVINTPASNQEKNISGIDKAKLEELKESLKKLDVVHGKSEDFTSGQVIGFIDAVEKELGGRNYAELPDNEKGLIQSLLLRITDNGKIRTQVAEILNMKETKSQEPAGVEGDSQKKNDTESGSEKYKIATDFDGLYAEVSKLKAIESRGRKITSDLLIADMKGLQKAYLGTGEGSDVNVNFLKLTKEELMNSAAFAGIPEVGGIKENLVELILAGIEANKEKDASNEPASPEQPIQDEKEPRIEKTAEANEAIARKKEEVSLKENELKDLETKYEDKKRENAASKGRFRRLFGKVINLDRADAEESELKKQVEKAQDELARLRAQYARMQESAAAQEIKPETQETEPESVLEKKPQTIEEKFQSQFGIKKEDLERVPGFKDLSEGRQALVLENLGQLTLGRIQDEASDKYESDVQNSKLLGSKFLGRMWKGLTKHYQVAKHERQTAREILRGGISSHGEVLKHLVTMASEGPEAMMKDGKIELQFATNFGNLSESEQKKVTRFNEVANRYARMAYESTLNNNSSNKEYRGKLNLENEYSEARRELLNLKKEKCGDEMKALVYMNNLERNIQLNQFLNTNSDMEKRLQNIDSDRIWSRVFKDTLAERAGYFAYGFGARTLAVGALNFAGASMLSLAGIPLAAGGVGAYFANKRAKETLRSRERKARRGIEDKSQEAKEFVDINHYNDSIDFLVKELEKEQNEAKKEEMVRSLNFQIKDAMDNIEKGTINYGSAEEKLANQYMFIRKLSVAETFLMQKDLHLGDRNFGGTSEREKTKNQYAVDLREIKDKILAVQEKNVSEAQKSYIRKQTWKGAGIAAGFALGGALARDLYAGYSGGDSVVMDALGNGHHAGSIGSGAPSAGGHMDTQVPGSGNATEAMPAPSSANHAAQEAAGAQNVPIPETEPKPLRLIIDQNWQKGKSGGTFEGTIKKYLIEIKGMKSKEAGAEANRMWRDFIKEHPEAISKKNLNLVHKNDEIYLSPDGKKVVAFQPSQAVDQAAGGGKKTVHTEHVSRGSKKVVNIEEARAKRMSGGGSRVDHHTARDMEIARQMRMDDQAMRGHRGSATTRDMEIDRQMRLDDRDMEIGRQMRMDDRAINDHEDYEHGGSRVDHDSVARRMVLDDERRAAREENLYELRRPQIVVIDREIARIHDRYPFSPHDKPTLRLAKTLHRMTVGHREDWHNYQNVRIDDIRRYPGRYPRLARGFNYVHNVYKTELGLGRAADPMPGDTVKGYTARIVSDSLQNTAKNTRDFLDSVNPVNIYKRLFVDRYD